MHLLLRYRSHTQASACLSIYEASCITERCWRWRDRQAVCPTDLVYMDALTKTTCIVIKYSLVEALLGRTNSGDCGVNVSVVLIHGGCRPINCNKSVIGRGDFWIRCPTEEALHGVCVDLGHRYREGFLAMMGKSTSLWTRVIQPPWNGSIVFCSV